MSSYSFYISPLKLNIHANAKKLFGFSQIINSAIISFSIFDAPPHLLFSIQIFQNHRACFLPAIAQMNGIPLRGKRLEPLVLIAGFDPIGGFKLYKEPVKAPSGNREKQVGNARFYTHSLRIRTNKLDTPQKIRYNKEMIVENKRKAYESDLTDSQWEIIEPLMWKSGNKSKWEKRELINAVLYLVDSGCKWRQLPHDFPPHTTVSNFYYKAVREGLWEKILKVTVIKTREEAGRSPEPSYALIDSQSVKTAYSSDERGYDGGKNKGNTAQSTCKLMKNKV